ncbi:hypothetical protein QTP70_000763 [Hemibagrus guttatus]|uniref:Sleeping Beauty transposase HTH domain-containing protein n=1 Tax=Hemibagrus guttatus TaxID=175788 RepID=A0AAE0V2A1_9TELE|nr:hypothetical protein QTP70_000763 [Hemibagrus guttatus]
MNHLFKVMPQHLNGIEVRTLTRPLQSLHFVFLQPFRGGLAGVFWIIVLLQNPSSLQLEVTNLPIYQSVKGYKAISKALRLPRTTVRAIIYKWRKHGTVENLPRSGRPTKITPRAQQQLIQEVTKDHTTTSKELQTSLASVKRELRSAARKWKKSKLDTDLISYRTLLSKFSLDVTSAKTSFYKEKLETSAQDPRKLHNIFSSLLNPPAPPSPSSLTAEDFATFYTEKIERICQTFMSPPTSSTSHSQHSTTPSLTQLSTLAAEEFLQIIRSCNPTTCPLDPIPSAMLQTISPDLLPFITTVINGSLTSGHVPTVFKKASVIPILKKPALDPSDISNYRSNNLHDPNQSGFKAAHSTETALLAVTEKLHAARSAKLSSVLILLDLSAAFDTVNHKTLLSTLGVLEFVEQHGNGLLPTWMFAHIRYHGFYSDLSVSGGHFILDDGSSAETQS